jgi:hypothetical protein
MTTEHELPNYVSNTLPRKNGLKPIFLLVRQAASSVLEISEISLRHGVQTGPESEGNKAAGV